MEKSSDGTQSLVQAFTSDGQLMWETTLPALVGNPVPDAFGGVVLMEGCKTSDPVNNPLTIVDLDGGTGTVLWQGAVTQSSGQLNVCLAGLPKLAIRPDGAVVVSMPLQISPAMVVLDGATGQTILNAPIPPSTFTSVNGQVSSCDCFTPVGQPIVDSDGSVYVEYFIQNDLQFYPTRGVLWLLKIAPDGSASTTQLSSYDAGHLWPGQVIPDGQGGILATWAIDNTFSPGAYHPYQAAHVTSGVATAPFDMPMAPQNLLRDSNTGIPLELPLVLGENSTAFVSYGTNVTSFNLNGGSTNWNYQNTQGIGSMSYTNGGGLTLIDGQSNQIPLDASGNAGPSVSFSSFSFLQPSWTGAWQGAVVSSSIALASISAPFMDWGNSFWVTQMGSPSPTGTSVENPWFPSLDHCTSTPGCIGHYEAIYNALQDLIVRLKDPVVGALAQSKIFNNLGSDANGNPATTNGFLAYLSNQKPLVYDGVRSTYCKDSLDSGSHCFTMLPFSLFNGQLVKDSFAADASQGAVTRTPGNPLLSFLRPSSILFPSLGRNIGNESLVFHEALHGYTGLYDRGTIPRPLGIIEKLQLDVNAPSCDISAVIAIDVLSHSAGLDPTTSPCP
jgi:hypothetical protein